MKKPLILLIGVGSVLSCHKDQDKPSNGWDWFGTHDSPVYNYVLISANQVTNKSDSNDYQIAVAAAFIDSNTNKLAGVSDLVVNELSIVQGTDSTYNFGYNNTPYFQQGLSLFGTDVSVKIKGVTAADTVNKTVYLPKRLVKLISDFPDVVDLSKPLNLYWDPDERNYWGNVIIQVYYYPGLSSGSDPTLPKQIDALHYTAPDRGSYTISAADLKRFPEKAFVGISIARGSQNQAVLPVSKKRVYFFSSSSASTVPLLVSSGVLPVP
jgi:hypothetical protein